MSKAEWQSIKAIAKRELPECLKHTVKEVESCYGVTLSK